MRDIRQKHDVQSARCRGVLVLFALMALSVGRVAAQPEPAEPGDRPDRRTEPIEEVTVRGQRPLRELRLEVQVARERVYDLFNSLNSDDEFDIHCRNEPRTGTRIPQRVCRPRFADDATGDAASAFVLELFYACGDGEMSEACLARAFPRAQTEVSVVPVKDQQLAADVQRVAREHREFRRAITEYWAVDARYDDARRAEEPALQASASIVDAPGAKIASRLAERQEDETVSPEPVDLVTPDSSRLGEDAREGWVKLRYSVLADGATADVRVVDAMPAGLDPASAMAAVQAWTFEPATADGVPVDWHNNLAVIVFSREEAEREGSPEFAEAYEEVAELVSDERYERAKARNERMQRELAVTLDDVQLAQLQLAAIERALGDPHAALAAIRRATEPAIPQLADEELTFALEHRFALELQLGLAVDALETNERRAAVERLPSGHPLARQGETLEQSLRAPDTSLAARGRIDDNGRWAHALTWRTFAVGDVDGRNENLEVACDRNRALLPFEADVEVTIPAAWGECVLLVEGRPDTTFMLHEFRQPLR